MDTSYCRVCLQHGGADYSIHEIITKSSTTLHTVLSRLCPAAFVSKNSYCWPTNVCKSCRKRIMDSQELYELCMKSAEWLGKQALQGYGKKGGRGMVPPEQLRDSTLELEDEIDSDFFAPSEDSVPETQNYLNDRSNLSLDVVDSNDESLASIDSDWFLNTTEQPNVSDTMAASSNVELDQAPDTFDVGIAIGTIKKDANSGTADVKVRSSVDGDLSSEESEDETAKIFAAKVYYCTKCQRPFYEKITYKKHLKYHEVRRNNFCNLCEKGFSSKSLLSEHREKHDNSLLCMICGEMSDTAKGNKRHYENHSRVRKYACPKCPLRFYTSIMRSSHLKTHSGSRLFCCDVCGQRLSSKKNLKNHKTAKHSGKYETKGSTHDHTLLNTFSFLSTIDGVRCEDVRPFSCDICGLKFVTKEAVKKHMITHTGERPHGCMFCDRRYGSVGDLKDHLRKHVGDNIYQCDRCDAAFRLKVELREHYAVHFEEGEDPASSYPPNFRLTINDIVSLRYHKELAESTTNKSE